MIGMSSFLLESAGGLIGLILLLGGLWSARRQRSALAVAAVGLVFTLLMGQRYLWQWRAHAWLEGLRPEAVRAIRVGDRTVADPGEVRAMVQALNGARWFSANHGGWDRPVPLEIESDPPAPVRLTAARYQRQDGWVLAISRGGGWADGYAFVPGAFLPR